MSYRRQRDLDNRRKFFFGFYVFKKVQKLFKCVTVHITQHKPHTHIKIRYVYFDHLKLSKSQNEHEFSFIICLR